MNNFDVYLFDGSFYNLLNTIEVLIKEKIKPSKIVNENIYVNDLFSNVRKKSLSNNDDFAKKLKKISLRFYNIIYDVYLSDNQNKELIIYYFILNGLKYGEKILYLRKLKCVNEALNISNYVHREAHKLKGFVRFKKLETNFYLAYISPTNNVIEYLSAHFKKRLSNESWMIYDLKRDLLSIYTKEKYMIIKVSDLEKNELKFSSDEKDFENLWLTFYQTIAIKERENKKCQMNFMPKKYWPYMIEMSDECVKSN